MTDAQAIARLLRLAIATRQSYKRLIVCCPFISETLFDTKVASHGAWQVPILIITRDGTAEDLLKRTGALNAPVVVTAAPNFTQKRTWPVAGRSGIQWQ